MRKRKRGDNIALLSRTLKLTRSRRIQSAKRSSHHECQPRQGHRDETTGGSYQTEAEPRRNEKNAPVQRGPGGNAAPLAQVTPGSTKNIVRTARRLDQTEL